MSLFKVDKSQAEEREFKLLPEGEYEVFPVAGEVTTSSTGNEGGKRMNKDDRREQKRLYGILIGIGFILAALLNWK